HLVRRAAEIEMHVDVDVELARQGEDAVDLALRIAVAIGRGAEHLDPLLQRLHQPLLGAGIVEQSLLRKDADLDIDRPGIVARQLPDAVEPGEADRRIDLDMRPDMRGAVQDGALERAAGARIDVLDGEALLGGGDVADRLLERAFLCAAAIEDAGLVEMEMRLDETGADQPAAEIERLALR